MPFRRRPVLIEDLPASDLDFAGAQKEFEQWEKANPDDAMGPVSEAAGVLFSEFDRPGVLEAQVYEDDSVFAARKKYEADPAKRSRFEQQLDRAEKLAKSGSARIHMTATLCWR